MTTGTSDPLSSTTPLHKAYSITNIKSHIPLTLNLDHLNYDAWADLFETLCIGFDVIDHIDGTYDNGSCPTDPEWVKLDSIVRMWIYSTIAPDVLENIHEKKLTARATWLNIETLFSTNKDTTAFQLEHDLRNITLGDLSIKDYCTKIKSIYDLLKNLGETVSDKHLVMYTLQGLPRKWNGVTRAIRLRETQPTWLQTRAILLSEESKLDDNRSSTTTSSSPAVLLTSSARNYNRGNGRRHDRRGGGRRNEGRQPPSYGQYGWVYIPPPPRSTNTSVPSINSAPYTRVLNGNSFGTKGLFLFVLLDLLGHSPFNSSSPMRHPTGAHVNHVNNNNNASVFFSGPFNQAKSTHISHTGPSQQPVGPNFSVGQPTTQLNWASNNDQPTTLPYLFNTMTLQEPDS